MASSSQRSQRELIDFLTAYTDMPPHEPERLLNALNADCSTLTQEEHDKFMNTVVRVDLDHLVDHINRVRAGDNTVLNLLPQPRAKPKARSKKCSGPATKR